MSQTEQTTSHRRATRGRGGLRIQLLSAFALLCALLVVVAATSLWGLNSVRASARQAASVDSVTAYLADQVAIGALLCRRYEKDYLLSIHDPALRSGYLEQWRQAEDRLRSAIAAFSEHVQDPALTAQAASWRGALERYVDAFDEIVTGVEAGQITRAVVANEALAPFKEPIRELSDASVQVAGERVEVAQSSVAAMERTGRDIAGRIVMIVLLALLLGGVWSVVFPARLIRPIALMDSVTSRLAQGDLRARIELERSDELGRLAESFNHMAHTLETQVFELEQRTRQARELQQAESDGRRRLEQAVADYLDLVRAVANGQLGQRVGLPYDGALGELGQGLNAMAGRLEQAREETERLRAAETESRQLLERAVDEFLRFVQQVAGGNLTQRLSVSYDGALGSLGQGLNAMTAALQQLTRQISQSSHALASVSSELMAATSQQSAAAVEQSTAISQMTTTVEEIKAIAQQTAEQASRVVAENQTTITIARQGATAVEQNLTSMQRIKARVEEIAGMILQLAEQNQSIGTIIQTVNELSDQSNLLALNATIEAARAGEHGKSFAVVAQHVRALANRSKDATVQVRAILEEIQQATNTAVMATEEGNKGVSAGSELATAAGEVIQHMAAEVEHGAQANTQMAAAAQQQTAGMEQIGTAMQQIQQATAQTLASTRQAERAAQDLNALARELQATVAAYQV